MIRVKRDKGTPNIPVYTEKTKLSSDGKTQLTKAEKELEKAIEFFTDKKNYKSDKKITRSSFDFEVYKDKKLRALLTSIFNDKCAYCEGEYAHVAPTDYEHFRPKNAVDTGDGTFKPGYYWLAGDWNNLLISCIDCNRSREHEVPGQAKKVKLGKLDQFPLRQKNHVRSHNDDIGDEESDRLLINPCIDNPKKHFSFDEEGIISAKGKPLDMGKKSIEVYALQRKGLVEKRKTEMLDLTSAIEQLKHLISIHPILMDSGSAEKVKDNLKQIEQLKNDLERRTNAKAPYLGMKYQYIRKFKRRKEHEIFKKAKYDLGKLITS